MIQVYHLLASGSQQLHQALHLRLQRVPNSRGCGRDLRQLGSSAEGKDLIESHDVTILWSWTWIKFPVSRCQTWKIDGLRLSRHSLYVHMCRLLHHFYTLYTHYTLCRIHISTPYHILHKSVLYWLDVARWYIDSMHVQFIHYIWRVLELEDPKNQSCQY